MSERFCGLLDSDNAPVARGNIRRLLLNCPYDDCGSGLSNVCKRCYVNDMFPWLLSLKCHSCGRSWVLCRQCKKSQVMLSDIQVTRHNRRFHSIGSSVNSRKKNQSSVSNSNTVDGAGHDNENAFSQSISLDDTNENTSNLMISSGTCFLLNAKESLNIVGNVPFTKLIQEFDLSEYKDALHILNIVSANYFLAQSTNNGIRYLVLTAQNGKIGTMSSLSDTESLLQMNISFF
jgi:hypothetical protein